MRMTRRGPPPKSPRCSLRDDSKRAHRMLAGCAARARVHNGASITYFAVQPPSMVNDEPVAIPAPGPASQSASMATSSGSTRRLDRVLGEQHGLDNLLLGDAMQSRLVGDLLLDQGRADIAGADAVAGHAARAAFERDHL